MNKFVIFCVIALYGASYSAVEGASRIIGGTAANENQFRYMVSLQQKSLVQELTRGHRCGGALISYSHALTAASCLHNNNTGVLTLITPAEYRLFAGSSRLDNDNSTERVQDVLRFTVHPQFLPREPLNNDIAIITVAIAFSSAAVTPLQLPATNITETNLSVCNSPGWGGQNDTATASYQLMFVQKRVSPNLLCSIFYQGTPITMQSSMLCAVPMSNSSGCQGDIGNPLVCDDRLAGILFLSKDCSVPTLGPDVYTRVFNYRDWVNETVFDPPTDGASTYQPAIGLVAMYAFVQIITSML